MSSGQTSEPNTADASGHRKAGAAQHVRGLRPQQGLFFKIRRFWIELQLADGRKISSDIAAATFTQPPSWPYAEGVLVPHGQDITVDLWFQVKPSSPR